MRSQFFGRLRNHARASPRRHFGRSSRISAARNPDSDLQCLIWSQKVLASWKRRSSGKSYCSDGSKIQYLLAMLAGLPAVVNPLVVMPPDFEQTPVLNLFAMVLAAKRSALVNPLVVMPQDFEQTPVLNLLAMLAGLPAEIVCLWPSFQL